MESVGIEGVTERRRLRSAPQPSAHPLVSVVIPCLNEVAHLEPLLAVVREQTVALHEVIVVDGGSRDGSQALVRDYQQRHPDWPLRLVTGLRAGVAAAMNVGVSAASGDVIVRLDGHCKPRLDYVERSVAGLADERAGVVGGIWDVVAGRDTLVGHAIADVLSHTLATGGADYRRSAEIGPPRAVDTVPFGCYRKSLWQQLGGYYEGELVSEDYLFNYRTRLTGARVILDPSIRCRYFAEGRLFRHFAPRSFKRRPSKGSFLLAYGSSLLRPNERHPRHSL